MASIILPASPSESRPGRFGVYGGRYVPETLMAALLELEHEYEAAKADAAFQAELDSLLTRLRRPAHAALLRQAADGTTAAAQKSTSSAKTCSTPARTRSTTRSARDCWPSAWARSASSPRPARASTAWPRPRVCALLGLECVIYMGDVDMERQELNVLRMRLLGAEVRGVSLRLEDAQRRHQRGHARLGHQRPHHLLPAGQRPRRASLPHHGARLPSLHQPRDEGADPGERRPPAHRRHRLRRRRVQRHRRVLRVHSRSRRCG